MPSLHEVASALEEIAPLPLAEEWDNVGLLIEPPGARTVERLLLTIDLTRAVMEEAIRTRTQMIIAYHPPIFQPVKRLHAGDLPAALISARVAVYCPHTALDAAPGGVNDWLADGLGAGQRRPILGGRGNAGQTHKVVTFVPRQDLDRVRVAMSAAGAGVIGHYEFCSFNTPGFGTFQGNESTHPAVGRKGRLETVEEVRLEMVCGVQALPAVARAIHQSHPYEEPAWEVYTLAAKPSITSGQGREVQFDKPLSLDEVVRRIKRHLGLRALRLARSSSRGAPVRTIALCAGAGGSVLSGQRADVYLTGEMRHHDILAANARGTSVILCDHTNTERGYLPVLKEKLREKLGHSVRINISKADHEPLEIV